MSEQCGTPYKKRTAHCSCGPLRVETVGEPLIVTTCFCEDVSDHLDDVCIGSPRLLMTFTGG
jgi:hypothetical protein